MADLAYGTFEARAVEPRVSERTETAPQAVLDWFTAICEAERWTLSIEPGCELWLRTLQREGHWINPCFDPAKSDVDEANSLSIVIEQTATGRFVAANTLRLWHTDSFLGLIAGGEVFYSRRVPEHRELRLIVPPDYPDLSGHIGYSGGTVIDPGLRGSRLGLMTTRMARLLAELGHRVDHHTGMCFYPRGSDASIPMFHFARVHHCTDGLDIDAKKDDRPFYYLEMTREEFLAQSRRDIDELALKGEKKLSDLALLRA